MGQLGTTKHIRQPCVRELAITPMGLPPGRLSDKNPPTNVEDRGDIGSVSGGRSPGEGNGNLLQYYCQDNPMDRGAWRATDHGVLQIMELQTVRHD